MSADDDAYRQQYAAYMARVRAAAGVCPRCATTLDVLLWDDGELDGQYYFDEELVCPVCGWSSWGNTEDEA